jgi:hypothetical protein
MSELNKVGLLLMLVAIYLRIITEIWILQAIAMGIFFAGVLVFLFDKKG